MDCGLCIDVFLTVFEAVIHTTQIANGALRPVMVVVYLHFQVYLLVIIYYELNVQTKFLGAEGGADFNRVVYYNRSNLLRSEVKKRAEQSCESLFILLKRTRNM